VRALLADPVAVRSIQGASPRGCYPSSSGACGCDVSQGDLAERLLRLVGNPYRTVRPHFGGYHCDISAKRGLNLCLIRVRPEVPSIPG
jgi:hypothetical protein